MLVNILYTDVSKLDLGLYTKLPPFRQKLFDNYKFEKDKRLSLGAWLLFMEVFGDASVLYTEYKKPYIPGSSIKFNLSHSGKYAMMAYADDDIGCDIEKIKPYDDKLARFCMQDDEIRTIDSDSRMFYHYWTYKESYMKATAHGLNISPRSFAITDIRDYSFAKVQIDKKYCSAVCLRSSSIKIFVKAANF